MATELLTTLGLTLQTLLQRKTPTDSIQQGTASFDLSIPQDLLTASKNLSLSHGTDSDEADLVWASRLSISGGGSHTINLTDGSLTNNFGEALVFAEACLFFAKGVSGNTVFRGDSGFPTYLFFGLGFYGAFASAAGQASVSPGDVLLSTMQSGLPISSFNNEVNVLNVGGASVADIIIIGRSA